MDLKNNILKYILFILLILIPLESRADEGSKSLYVDAELPSFSIIENECTSSSQKNLTVIKTMLGIYKLNSETKYKFKTNSSSGISAEFKFTDQTNQGTVEALSGVAGTNRGIAVFTRNPLVFNSPFLNANKSAVENITLSVPVASKNPNALGFWVYFVNDSGANPIFLYNKSNKAVGDILKRPGNANVTIYISSPVSETFSIQDIDGVYQTTVMCTLIKK